MGKIKTEKAEKVEEIDLYQRLESMRNILKNIKQLSWDINQLERNYPETEIKDIGYEKFIKIFLRYNDRLQEIAKEFSDFVENDEIIKKL